MAKSATIASLFRVPHRFLRSVQLEADFEETRALDEYILTPPMAEAFRRISDGLQAGSGRRAWRITGDYGVGKSSFALVLAHLLREKPAPSALRISDAIGLSQREEPLPRLWPILLTGSRTSLTSAVARAIRNAVQHKKPSRGPMPKPLIDLDKRAQRVIASNDLTELETLLVELRSYAEAQNTGVLLIIDELGKLLEHAAQNPDREDVFVLQRLAEATARGPQHPFILIGLLHQGFHAYAERLPSAIRHEWEKVAGRFEEIVFDQPLAHTAALVAGALNIDAKRLPLPVRDAARGNARATAVTGWLGGATSVAHTLDAASLYPLHPMLLPVLVRFFARFGQHERSLFGFLLSNESFGLQNFAARAVAPEHWYTLPTFYDYVRTVFGHRLAGASYRNHWLRIIATIDGTPNLSDIEEQVLKAVAVLNLLDAEDLQATPAAVKAIFTPQPASRIEGALRKLVERGSLFQRGRAGAYRLWPNSSVSLDVAFQQAGRTLGPQDGVAQAIPPYLDHEPVLARRHYLEHGTLRYFEMRYAPVSALDAALAKQTAADGLVVVALADTDTERQAALKIACKAPLADRNDVIIAVGKPLLGLAPDLEDARRWQWIADNTPELSEDSYASAELSRQLALSKRTLAARLNRYLGLRHGSAEDVQWFRNGKPIRSKSKTLTALVSDVCDQLFPDAPRITNELLNRNTISSAAAAARMRLIEGLFTASELPLLGIDPDRAPPEKSMYLSVIAAGRLHVPTKGGYAIVEPDTKDDPLNLRPSLDHLISSIEAAQGDRLTADRLLSSLKRDPFGVRAGVAPLLLAILLRTRSHELAVYENGTFLHRFGPTDFLRLIKSPATFEIQHCQVEGVRVQVFERLAEVFCDGQTTPSRNLLDVVRPLCQFAAQLPEYTRRATTLGDQARAVRDTLLTARDPISLLFRDLPQACGLQPFLPEPSRDRQRVKAFVAALQGATGELRATYPLLLRRIAALVAEATGQRADTFDRAGLANRAARVSLAAREPRLRAFALRLRDPGLSDEAWAEALASFVVSKPPARWLSSDEARFCEDIAALSELFHKVEATAFPDGAQTPALNTIRLNLTRADGSDVVRIVEALATPQDLADEIEVLRKRLPQDRQVRLEILTQLVWNELNSQTQAVASESATPSRKGRPT